MTIGLVVHVLGAIVWVGGMFFAYVVLRPVAGEMEPGPRLVLWRGVFRRFFPWVWASVLGLLLSGYGMLLLGARRLRRRRRARAPDAGDRAS